MIFASHHLIAHCERSWVQFPQRPQLFARGRDPGVELGFFLFSAEALRTYYYYTSLALLTTYRVITVLHPYLQFKQYFALLWWATKR